MNLASFLIFALLLVVLPSFQAFKIPNAVSHVKSLENQIKQQIMKNLVDPGIPPKNYEFNRPWPNASSPMDSEIDVNAAVYTWASSYCAPGGGVTEYGTGPACQNNCHNCPCNKQEDGSYTWCGYPYNCVGYTWGLSDIQYGDQDSQPGVPFEISEVFNNSLDVPQTFTFSKDESYSNTYSWTFSTTLSDSMSISVGVDIPEICTIKDTFSTSISVTSSTTQSFTHDSQWSVSQTFNVPPNTAVQASMIITTATYNIPYTANIRFQGVGYAWCNNQVNGHWCWFPYASGILNFDGCYTSDGYDAICPFAGTFNGVQGVQAAVSIGPVQ